MYFIDRPNLRHHLVVALGQNAPLSARSLCERIAKSYRRCSIQAIYKELRSLERSGAVVRSSGGYALHLSWIDAQRRSVDKVERFYGSAHYLARVLPKTGGGLKWVFGDLARADLHWTQLSLALHQVCGHERSYAWSRYAWFDLVHPVIEQQFIMTMSQRRGQMVVVLGEECPLNLCYTQQYNSAEYRIINRHGPLDQFEDRCFEARGDYIVSVRMDKHTIAEIHHHGTSMINHRARQRWGSVVRFAGKSKIVIQLEHSPTKATRFRRLFQEYIV